MRGKEDLKAREGVWTQLVKLGIEIEQARAGTGPDLSNVPPHLAGRR